MRKAIVIVLFVLLLAYFAVNMYISANECISISHPEGQQVWTDVQDGKWAVVTTHHYRYVTVSCAKHK